MYTGLHMWDEALSLAEAKGHPRLDDLKTTHAKWLLDTGQEEKAGAIKEAEGDSMGALELYLQAGLATRASRLVKSDDILLSNQGNAMLCNVDWPKMLLVLVTIDQILFVFTEMSK